MKASSIKKRFGDERFAPGINREHITRAVTGFGITVDEHIDNLIDFLSALDNK